MAIGQDKKGYAVIESVSARSVGDNIVRKCNNIGLVFVIRYGALSCHSVYHSMYSTSLSCLHFFLCNPSIPLYNL